MLRTVASIKHDSLFRVDPFAYIADVKSSTRVLTRPQTPSSCGVHREDMRSHSKTSSSGCSLITQIDSHAPASVQDAPPPLSHTYSMWRTGSTCSALTTRYLDFLFDCVACSDSVVQLTFAVFHGKEDQAFVTLMCTPPNL